jgi:alkanesulfonate monooxygenase SsuD/methylene tetrahydromethanopterin reductase-like flavin-dependent oxidoreductase (luciferase family)
MYHGVNLPIIGDFADPTLLTELAVEAEQAGWDGVFVWDTLLFDVNAMPPVLDPWTVLAVLATRTTRVKIGPMVAQLARRPPWDVARQVITLDRLSQGRFILGAALGYAGEADFAHFGLPSDPRTRADLLDESLRIIAGLCSGEPFEHHGDHFTVESTVFRPRTVQRQVPVWIGGYWPQKRPMRRAARWQGAFPAPQVIPTADGFTAIPFAPKDVLEVRRYIEEHRRDDQPFDLVISHQLCLDDPAKAAYEVEQYERVGVTWIVRDWQPWETGPDEVRAQIGRGPLGTA